MDEVTGCRKEERVAEAEAANECAREDEDAHKDRHEHEHEHGVGYRHGREHEDEHEDEDEDEDEHEDEHEDDREDDREDLSDLSPEFLATLDGMHPGFRALFIETERDAMAALRARGGRPYDSSLAAATTVEALTGARLSDLRLAVEVHRLAVERREAAIRAARDVGYSWAELGRVVGVTPQALQRRYGRR